MTAFSFRLLRDHLDAVFAQGLRLTSSTTFGSLIQACSELQLPQPAALLKQVEHQMEHGNVDQQTAEALLKVLQTLKHVESLTCKADLVDMPALQKVRPEQRVYIAREKAASSEIANLNNLLSIPNPFVRTYQVTHYLKHACFEDLRQSLEFIWFDYSLMTAITDGLASRPEEAFKLAHIAIASKNLVMQRIALTVLEFISADPVYRRTIIDMLRERVRRLKEPMKYVFMETIATIEGTHTIYRMAQQKFFNEHAMIIRQLHSSKKSERGKAIKALAKTKNPCFTNVLITMLDDPQIAAVATESLFKIGAFPAIPQLVHMLGSNLQHNAALALYKFGDRQGLEYFLRRKMLRPLENYVTFTDYGSLLLPTLMRLIKRLEEPEKCAKGCWAIFNSIRSHDCAQQVLQYIEQDTTLAHKLTTIIGHAYPGQYAKIITTTQDTSLEKIRTLITATLGENENKVIARLKHKYLIYNILATPDGARIIILDARGDISVWNTGKWKKMATFALQHDQHHAYLHAVGLTPDGRYLLTTNSNKNTVEILEFGKWKTPYMSLQHSTEVYGIGTTSDGKYILGGGKEVVKIWEWGTWREITTLSGHQHGIEVVKAVPEKPFVVTADRQGLIQVWRQDSWKKIVDFKVKSIIANSVAFSPHGTYMVVVETLATYLETSVRIWKTDTWQEVAFFAIPSQTPVTCFAFTPDGKYLLTGSDEIKFLEVGTWKEVLTLANRDTRALAVTPDGKHVIAGQNVWEIDRAQLG